MILNNSKDYKKYLEKRNQKDLESEERSPSIGGEFDLDDLKVPATGHTVSGNSSSRTGRDTPRNQPHDHRVQLEDELTAALEKILEDEIPRIGRAIPPLGTHQVGSRNLSKSKRQRKYGGQRGTIESNDEIEDATNTDQPEMKTKKAMEKEETSEEQPQ